MDTELSQRRIIKFLLQPLLENSILHGLTPPYSALRIIIIIKHVDTFLELTIRDNGAGMNAERLTQVRRHMTDSSQDASDKSHGSFIGLYNIWKRLELFYNHQARIFIDSQEGKGTSILIRIPFSYTEGI